MLGIILKTATAGLCILGCAIKTNALSEGNIIYIQEDGAAAFSRMASEILSNIWKDAVSFSVAAVCTALMLILAIKLKKRGK